MTPAQHHWWTQAKSDLAVFEHLCDEGYSSCHPLHYLQMSTEKPSKAYLWGSGVVPPRSHAGFVRFLRHVVDQTPDLNQVATIFGFRRAPDLRDRIRQNLPVAYAIQALASAEAGDGPNPEYPWPHDAPANNPASHPFALWVELQETSRGRKMLDFIGRAIAWFDRYA